MRDETARALRELNRRFYQCRAGDFSQTRAAPWPGWERCLPFLAPHAPGAAWRVLDAGCGNGRLATFLAPHVGEAFEYHGLDESPALLALAQERVRDLPLARLSRVDLISQALPPGESGYDAVALFGVLHHVPGRARRAALLRRLAEPLAPGGHLVATVWRADRFERFRDRLVPWEACEERTGIALDPTDLEPGDALLPWKHDPEALRYCHFPDPAEVEAWIAAAGLAPRERFAADGREGELNGYLVLGPAVPSTSRS